MISKAIFISHSLLHIIFTNKKVEMRTTGEVFRSAPVLPQFPQIGANLRPENWKYLFRVFSHYFQGTMKWRLPFSSLSGIRSKMVGPTSTGSVSPAPTYGQSVTAAAIKSSSVKMSLLNGQSPVSLNWATIFMDEASLRSGSTTSLTATSLTHQTSRTYFAKSERLTKWNADWRDTTGCAPHYRLRAILLNFRFDIYVSSANENWLWGSSERKLIGMKILQEFYLAKRNLLVV